MKGVPQTKVLQAGFVHLHEHSKKPTPYMIGNHMIAAGVTGAVTWDAGKIPDVRRYEAQDLVAAEFLLQYHRQPDIHPDTAKRNACMRWFGNEKGSGAPNPKDAEKKIICILAEIDLSFDPNLHHDKYNWKSAEKTWNDVEKSWKDLLKQFYPKKDDSPVKKGEGG